VDRLAGRSRTGGSTVVPGSIGQPRGQHGHPGHVAALLADLLHHAPDHVVDPRRGRIPFLSTSAFSTWRNRLTAWWRERAVALAAGVRTGVDDTASAVVRAWGDPRAQLVY